MSKYPIQAQVLHEAMTRQGVNRASLARQTGLSPTSIAYYLSGEKMMSFTNAVKIAGALDITLDYLATGNPTYDTQTPKVVNEDEFSLVQAFRSWMAVSQMENKMSRHLFLRGAACIEKSQLIRKAVISHLDQVGGYYLQQIRDGDQIVGAALNPIRDDFEYVLIKQKDADNERRMILSKQNDTWSFHSDVFAHYGVQYLRESLSRNASLIVLDETGGMELRSKEFCDVLYEALDTTPCIGAIKDCDMCRKVEGDSVPEHCAMPVREQYLKLLTNNYSTKFLFVTTDNMEKNRHRVLQFVNANLPQPEGGLYSPLSAY